MINTKLRRYAGGLTLVEVLVVVVAILAAIVIPHLVDAADLTRENSLRMNLHQIRMQLEIYREHHDKFPSLGGLEAQLTDASDADGDTAAPGTPGYPFGPYLLTVPNNPNSGGNTIGDGDVGSSDWYYDQGTGDFRANDSQETREY